MTGGLPIVVDTVGFQSGSIGTTSENPATALYPRHAPRLEAVLHWKTVWASTRLAINTPKDRIPVEQSPPRLQGSGPTECEGCHGPNRTSFPLAYPLMGLPGL